MQSAHEHSLLGIQTLRRATNEVRVRQNPRDDLLKEGGKGGKKNESAKKEKEGKGGRKKSIVKKKEEELADRMN